MIIHRKHLTYGPQLFTVTFCGDAGKLADVSQKWSIEIESASRGRPREPVTKEMSGTLDNAVVYVESILDPEFPGITKRWQDFMFNPLGSWRIEYSAAMLDLIKEYGVKDTRDRLESRKEPEIVALCGGLENALTVLDHCKDHPWTLRACKRHKPIFARRIKLRDLQSCNRAEDRGLNLTPPRPLPAR